jgi:gliding motility-associated lipoprotein GldD
MKINTINILFWVGMMIISASCNEDAARTPKARMFPRVDYPVKAYKDFDSTFCNFTFRMPNYGKIVQDSSQFNQEQNHPCWFDISVPALNSSVYCSYYKLTKQKTLSSLVEDAFTIAGKHNIKANYRKETIIDNGHGVKGILFEIEGPVASPLQFYLTDEKDHFFRASLYFNSKVNPDSTAPVLKYLRSDIDTLIASFKWKK